MSTNYIAPIWRMPRNANNTPVDKLSNYSMEFDAGTSSQAINCGTSDNVDITGPISISVWFNASALSSSRGIVCKNDNVAQQTSAQYFFDILNGDLRWRAGRSTVTYTIQADQWYHAVGVYDGSNTTLYIDGAQVATTAASASSYQSNEPMYIGRRLAQSYFGGKIAQVCIFDYALSIDQRNYLYNLNNPMAITGAEPVAYWPLGDNSNPSANAGYPNISVGADSVFDFESGSTTFIKAFDVPVTTFTECTFSAWVNFESIAGTYQYVMGMGSGPGNFMSISKFQNSGPFYTYDGSGTRLCAVNPVANRWYHVVVTQTGTTRRFYIDGVEDANSPFTVQALAIPYDNLTLGAYNNQPPSSTPASPLYRLDGQLSNVQVWDTVLELSDVEELYNNGQPLMTSTQPQEANLKAWYKLNQSANWEADTTGNWQIPDAVSSYPQSFDFGTRSQAEYIALNKLPLYNAITVSAWIKTQKNGSSRQTIISNSQPNAVANEKGWQLAIDQAWSSGYTKAGFVFYDSTGSTAITIAQTSSQELTDNKWHHVVALWDGTTNTNAAKIFVDGLLAGQGTSSFAGPIGQPVIGLEPRIGSQAYSTSGGGNYFGGDGGEDGFISNVQTWDSSLTYGTVSSIGDAATGQIAELYNNGVPLTTAIATDNLKGWWKLDNTETFTQDASGNEEWAVFNNTASPAITGTAISNLNGAVNPGPYGGYNYYGWRAANYSDPTNYHSLPTTHLGFSCWYKYQGPTIPAANATRYIFAATSSSYYMTFLLRDNGSFRIYGDASNKHVTSSSGELTNGEWHNICVYMPNSTTNNASDIKLWIDGVERNLSPSSGFTTYPQKTLWLGAYNYSGGGTTPRSDSFYDYVIYDTDISNDVSTIYNNGVPTDVSSLNPYAYYKFDSTNITFVSNRFELTDLSGNNRNAFGPYRSSNDTPRLKSNSIRGGSGTSSGMTEQNLVNNNVSVLNGESSGMNTTNLVQSNLTRTQPYSSYSINFDAADSDSFDTTKSLDGTVWSISYWIKIEESGSYAYHFENRDTTTDGLVVWGTNTNNLQLNLKINDTINSAFYTLSANDTWYNLCFTYNGSTIKTYVDGIEVNSWNVTKTLTLTDTMRIGNRKLPSPVYPIDGQMNGFAVWDVTLTAADANNLYNNGINQNLSNFRISPTNYWPMDENSTYFNGTVLVIRDTISGADGTGNNVIQENIVGNAPGSEASGTGTNLTIADLKGNMYNSDKNAYSINMADYADGVTNPANSGRSTEVPSV